MGISANRSLQTGAGVKVAELLPDLVRPDYAPMPSRTASLPMPGLTG